jgi:ABC-type sugar transport system ATPase subunit
MRAEIQRLQKRTGITSIYVTHDQVEAMSMAHRIAIMKKGIIQQVGSPTDVYLHPTNLFVATFIGSPEMNVLNGVIRQDQEKYYIETEIGNITVTPEIFDIKGRVGNKVYVGIRPEHLEIVTNGKSELKVSPDVIEPLGSDTFLYTNLGDKQFAIRHEGLLDIDFIYQHEEIGLNTKENQVYLFDFETEYTLRIAK